MNSDLTMVRSRLEAYNVKLDSTPDDNFVSIMPIKRPGDRRYISNMKTYNNWRTEDTSFQGCILGSLRLDFAIRTLQTPNCTTVYGVSAISAFFSILYLGVKMEEEVGGLAVSSSLYICRLGRPLPSINSIDWYSDFGPDLPQTAAEGMVYPG